ncbi:MULTISPECIES: hypothetical protein [unclassified Rhodococcus (in: high G+C Gram-positive bacteria)]|uniref:hypothetical protein n=1 Tax=unclassified Rhodococcus (in: high G+C Gram-positive bacteria) TaxID=192944 RepID=UPI001446BBC2|nr:MULTISPECIES: hypothetical protein [unclassified Rhodococcus (in: high G+C Gram-positive bacteria)]
MSQCRESIESWRDGRAYRSVGHGGRRVQMPARQTPISQTPVDTEQALESGTHGAEPV